MRSKWKSHVSKCKEELLFSLKEESMSKILRPMQRQTRLTNQLIQDCFMFLWRDRPRADHRFVLMSIKLYCWFSDPKEAVRSEGWSLVASVDSKNRWGARFWSTFHLPFSVNSTAFRIDQWEKWPFISTNLHLFIKSSFWFFMPCL